MNKPAVKANPAPKPAVKKTVAEKQATPAATEVCSAKVPAQKTTAPQPVAPVKATAKTTRVATPSQKPGVRSAVPSASASTPMKKPAAVSSTVTATPSAPAAATTPAPRVGRVSRLSQLTVPSMAQSVASTAAKSSFTQMVPSTLAPLPHVAAKKDPKLANNWKAKSAAQLSDAEVIAMPDIEYMNEKQMAFFRIKLDDLRKGILDNADKTTEHLRADTVVVPDPADRATIEEEHALELRTRDRERKLLKKIEQSISRIDAGDYGYCDETGEPIGVGRLLARPTATLSLEAQQRRELKQKMFGD